MKCKPMMNKVEDAARRPKVLQGGEAAGAREHQHNAGAEATPVTTSAAAAAVAGDAFGQPAAIPAGDGKRVSAADIQVRSFLCAFGGEWAPESYAAERTEDA